MGGPWGHYAKWSRSDRDKYHINTPLYVEYFKKKIKLIETENELVVANGRDEGCKWNRWMGSKGTNSKI